MIGDKIRKLREDRGIRQTEFANMLGIKKQTLYKYEINEVTNIPLERLSRIALLLGVTPSYLMGWEDKGVPGDAQNRILKDYERLNPEGKEKVREYIDDLMSSGRYTEDSVDAMVENGA